MKLGNIEAIEVCPGYDLKQIRDILNTKHDLHYGDNRSSEDSQNKYQKNLLWYLQLFDGDILEVRP